MAHKPARSNPAPLQRTQPAVQPPSRWPRWIIHLVASILIIGVGVAAYANALGNEFVYDDETLILLNDRITSFRHLHRVFTEDLFFDKEVTDFYRPLQTVTMMIDYRFWQLNPFGYHLTNLILHLGVALLLYALLNLLFARPGVALLTTLLWTVHPIHTEAVAYIAGRSDPLAALCLLLALLSYIAYDRGRRAAPRKIWLAVSTVGMIGAMLSRELSMLFPLLMLLPYHCVTADTPGRPGVRRPRRLPPGFFWLAAVGIAFAILRATALDVSEAPLAVEPDPRTPYQRVLTTLCAFGKYMQLLIAPFHLHMAQQIWRGLVPVSLLNPAPFIALWVVLGFATLWYLAQRRSTAAAFGFLWFILNWLPISGIIPLNADLAEHWMYLPSIGLFLAAATAIVWLCRWRWLRPAVLLGTTAALIWYATLTAKQNTTWKDTLTFYNYTLQYVSHDPRIPYNLGRIYAEQKRHQEAAQAYQLAIKIKPSHASAHFNLGLVYEEIGEREQAKQEYREALRHNPNHEKARINLAILESGGAPVQMMRTTIGGEGIPTVQTPRVIKIKRRRKTP